MKIKFTVLLVILCAGAFSNVFGQRKDTRLGTKGYINPQEIVSLDSTMRFDQALLVLSELSKQFEGKVIIDLERRQIPIGVYIVNQHWRDAFEMILTHHALWYEEQPEFIRIIPASAVKRVEEGLPSGAPAEPPPPF